MKKMKYTIIKERCTGCRFCERSCPGATQLNADGKAEIINENLLQQCGGERLCPFGAIENTQKDQDQELNPLKSGNYTVSRSNATTFQPNARTRGRNVPQNLSNNMPQGKGRGQGGMGRGMGRGQGGMGQNPINRRSNKIAGRDPHISRQGKNRNGNRKKNNNTKRG